jgi:hypothetical protein
MKIVMTLLVRNEDDILEENLLYHKEMGVDFFIVTNHRSTDGTTEILEHYKNKGWLEVITETSETYNQGVWVTGMARRACTEYSADWVINNDADEFWVPGTGTLSEYFKAVPADVGKLYANRLDFFYRPFNDAAFYEALLFREWVCKWKKCCHRGVSDITVEIGNHGAYSEELNAGHFRDLAAMNGMRVLHYPIRSFDRYRDKIAQGAQYMLNTPGIPRDSGFHWKMALEQIAQKTFDESFLEKVYSPDRIMRGIMEGQTVIDDALQRFFYNRHCRRSSVDRAADL